jgi:hypothetical protein
MQTRTSTAIAAAAAAAAGGSSRSDVTGATRDASRWICQGQRRRTAGEARRRRCVETQFRLLKHAAAIASQRPTDFDLAGAKPVPATCESRTLRSDVGCRLDVVRRRRRRRLATSDPVIDTDRERSTGLIDDRRRARSGKNPAGGFFQREPARRYFVSLIIARSLRVALV